MTVLQTNNSSNIFESFAGQYVVDSVSRTEGLGAFIPTLPPSAVGWFGNDQLAWKEQYTGVTASAHNETDAIPAPSVPTYATRTLGFAMAIAAVGQTAKAKLIAQSAMVPMTPALLNPGAAPDAPQPLNGQTIDALARIGSLWATEELSDGSTADYLLGIRGWAVNSGNVAGCSYSSFPNLVPYIQTVSAPYDYSVQETFDENAFLPTYGLRAASTIGLASPAIVHDMIALAHGTEHVIRADNVTDAGLARVGFGGQAVIVMGHTIYAHPSYAASRCDFIDPSAVAATLPNGSIAMVPKWHIIDFGIYMQSVPQTQLREVNAVYSGRALRCIQPKSSIASLTSLS